MGNRLPDETDSTSPLPAERLLVEFEEIRSKVNRIHDALLGTLLDPAGGALHRLTSMEMSNRSLRMRVDGFEEQTKRIDTWIRNALWAIITTMVLTLASGAIGVIWYFVQKGMTAEASQQLTDGP